MLLDVHEIGAERRRRVIDWLFLRLDGEIGRKVSMWILFWFYGFIVSTSPVVLKILLRRQKH